MVLIKLDLIRHKENLRFRQENGQRQIFGFARKKWLIVTPEELVRQLFIHYLIEEKNYNRSQLSVEKSLRINGLIRRFDLIVYDNNLNPLLLVECKAPTVILTQNAFDQVSQYNLDVQANYLLITNGENAYCAKMLTEERSYTFVAEVPSLLAKTPKIR